MTEEENCAYRCRYCGQLNEVLVDLSAGNHQEFVEDCSVCCRPNFLKVKIDLDAESVTIEAEIES
jgi:hypothetical protein